MNKVVVLALIGLIVFGCASTGSIEEANQKIANLEKRVAELEKPRGGLTSGTNTISLLRLKSARDLRLKSARDEKVDNAKASVDGIKGAMTAYMIMKKKATPPSDLKKLVEASGDEGPFLDGGDASLIDPWGNRFWVQAKGKRFVIVSNGPDGNPNTDDDIRSDRLVEWRQQREGLKRVREEKAQSEAERAEKRQQLQALIEKQKRVREAKAAEKTKSDEEKTKAFLREYLGVQMGDSIAQFTTVPKELGNESRVSVFSLHDVDGMEIRPEVREIPYTKKLWYFDKAEGWFFNGKLFYVELDAKIDKKYSVDSCNAQFDDVLKKIGSGEGDEGVVYTLRSMVCRNGALGELLSDFASWNKVCDYCVGRISKNRLSLMGESDGHFYAVGILNWRLGKTYRDEHLRLKSVKGEKLPEIK